MSIDPLPVTDADALAAARALRARADRCEVELLVAACDWADAHPCLPGDDPAYPDDHLPAVAWDATAPFALAIGLSDGAGTDLIHEGLEIRHRLPRIWRRLQNGTLTVWRARRIAVNTIYCEDDVAACLDATVAKVAHKVGPITIDRLIEEARTRLHPEAAEQAARQQLENRKVKLYSEVSTQGVGFMEIYADHKDLLDFDDLLTDLAAALAHHGDTDTLDVRRAKAVGVLGDPAAALDLLHTSQQPAGTTGDTSDGPSAGAPAGGAPADGAPADGAPAGAGAGAAGATGGTGPRRPARRPRKRMRLVVHLSADAVTGSQPVGRCETHGGVPVLVEQIRDWCGRTDTHLTIQPVIDLNGHDHVAAYEIPDRHHTTVQLRDITCVFPRCTRTATRCDTDHVIPWQPPDPLHPNSPGGATCPHNLAPLCRRHHRLKTERVWSYRMLAPGTYLWTSPHGDEYLRHEGGTTVVEPCVQPGQSVPHADTG